jgi:hypothetical protein
MFGLQMLFSCFWFKWCFDRTVCIWTVRSLIAVTVWTFSWYSWHPYENYLAPQQPLERSGLLAELLTFACEVFGANLCGVIVYPDWESLFSFVISRGHGLKCLYHLSIRMRSVGLNSFPIILCSHFVCFPSYRRYVVQARATPYRNWSQHYAN